MVFIHQELLSALKNSECQCVQRNQRNTKPISLPLKKIITSWLSIDLWWPFCESLQLSLIHEEPLRQCCTYRRCLHYANLWVGSSIGDANTLLINRIFAFVDASHLLPTFCRRNFMFSNLSFRLFRRVNKLSCIFPQASSGSPYLLAVWYFPVDGLIFRQIEFTLTRHSSFPQHALRVHLHSLS